MAFLFGDLFSIASSDYGKWDSNGFTLRQSGGRASGYCATAGYGGQNAIKTLASSYGTLIAGIDFYTGDWGTVEIHFYDGTTENGYVDFRLGSCTNGYTIKLFNAAGSEVGSYSLGGDGLNRWDYMEIKMEFGDSAAATVKLDEISVISVSGKDFKGGSNATSNKIKVLTNGVATQKIGLFYVCDTSGSHNTDFLGVRKGYVIVPDSDSSIAFSSTGANNYSVVADLPASTSSYVYANAAAVDKYGMSDVDTGLTIAAIQHNIICRKEAIGTDPLLDVDQLIWGNSGTKTALQTITPTTDWAWYGKVSEIDPDTTNPYTSTVINSMYAGVELA